MTRTATALTTRSSRQRGAHLPLPARRVRRLLPSPGRHLPALPQPNRRTRRQRANRRRPPQPPAATAVRKSVRAAVQPRHRSQTRPLRSSRRGQRDRLRGPRDARVPTGPRLGGARRGTALQRRSQPPRRPHAAVPMRGAGTLRRAPRTTGGASGYPRRPLRPPGPLAESWLRPPLAEVRRNRIKSCSLPIRHGAIRIKTVASQRIYATYDTGPEPQAVGQAAQYLATGSGPEQAGRDHLIDHRLGGPGAVPLTRPRTLSLSLLDQT